MIAPLGFDGPEGILGSSSYHVYFPNTPQNKAFTDEFTKATKRCPGSMALYGYVTGMLIAKAFEKAGKVEGLSAHVRRHGKADERGEMGLRVP